MKENTKIRAIMIKDDNSYYYENGCEPQNLMSSEIIEFESREKFHETQSVLSKYVIYNVHYKLIELIDRPLEIIKKAEAYAEKKKEEARIAAEKTRANAEKNKKARLERNLKKIQKELKELKESEA